MKRIYIIALAALLIAFSGLGIHNIVGTKQKIQLQDVQLQDKSAELKQLQLKYNILNNNLDTQLKDKNATKDHLDQLQQQKDQLEQQKKDLESQLQAKIDAKNAAAQRVQVAANNVGISATAYAASNDSDKMFIYMHESGNNPGSVNSGSGACGLGQALPCSKMPCSLSDYACQDNWFTNNYMIPRYGSWANAAAFWRAHLWW